MLYIDLILNLSLLVTLSIISSFIDKHWPRNTRLGQLFQGALFGGAAVLGMLKPLNFASGLIFDGRSIMMSLSAFFFGPLAAGVASMMAIACRISIGGIGMITGIMVILITTGIGLLAHFRSKPDIEIPSVRRLYLFGIVVHLAMLATMVTLPQGIGLSVVKSIGLPVILLYPLATVLCGKIMSDQLMTMRSIEELRLSEKRLIEMQHIAKFGNFIWDVHTGQIKWSSTLFDMLKYDKSEQIDYAKVNKEMHHPNNLERITQWLNDCVSSDNGVITPKEFRLFRKDGEVIYTRVSGVIKHEKGETPTVFVTVQDITEQKLLDKAHKESEKKFRHVFETANVGKSITLPTGEISANKAFAKLLGYTSKELLNKTWQELTPPDEIETIQATLVALQNGEKDSVRFKKRYIHKDGSFVWADVSTAIQRDKDGKSQYFITTVVDISEHVQAEEKLRLSEERFSTAFHVSPVAMTITRIADGKFIDVNKAFLKMSEFSREEVIGHTSTDLKMLSPRERDKLIQMQLESGGLRESELQARSQSGKIINILFSSGTMVLEGEPYHITVMVDITDRKKIEGELKDSKKLLGTLLHSIPDLVWLKDKQGNYLACNYRFESFFGAKEKDIIGKTDYDFVGKELADFLRNQDKIAIEEGHSIKNEEEVIFSYDGHREILETIKTPVYTNDGQLTGILGIGRDITQRIKSEQALRESEERFKRAFENIPDVVVIYDKSLRIRYINSASTRLTGRPESDFIGKYEEDIWPPEIYNKYMPILRAAQSTGRIQSIEIDLPLVNGTSSYLKITCVPLMDKKGKVKEILGITHDYTERKKAEDERLELEATLRQSQKMESIGTLAGGIAHDFNNILTTIIGNAYLMLMKVDKDDPLREEVEDIKVAGERAASLTRQLLAFSRKQIIQPKILDLSELLTDLEKMLDRLIGEDIDLLVISGPELWQVEADPGQMEQVIMNLVINAKDAMPRGGKVTIEMANVDLDGNYFRKHGVKEKRPGSYVILAVSDTGIGMDKETQEHIFEPFFTTKEIGKGTGLGLSTIYGIVKQNNGFIWVYSELGTGSTFKVYLPRVKGDAASEEKEQPPVTEFGGSDTVLIVEDDDGLRKLARTVLKQKGYKVLEAENGKNALRVSEAHDGSIDLLITDVVMPKMGGKEIAERLQPLHPQLKVIYMSGYTDNAIVHHGILAPGLNFIEKPFTPEELARKVRETLNLE